MEYFSLPSHVWKCWVWKCSVYLFVLHICSDGKINDPPQNTAVVAGSNAQLNCSTDNQGSGYSWSRTRSKPFIVSNSCFLDTSYTGQYDVINSPVGQCNLIILNVTSSSAGTYFFSDVASSVASAVLVVLDSTPLCSTNTTEVASWEKVELGCSVSFDNYNSSFNPVLKWTESTTTMYPTITSAYSSLIPETTIPQIPSYTCTLNFNPPGYQQQANPPANSSVALVLNAPTYTSTCTTSLINTSYCPVNMSVSSDKVPYGRVILTCTASANPPANYTWSCSAHNTNIAYSGSIVTIKNIGSGASASGVCNCTATNTVKGVQCSNSTIQDFNITLAGPPGDTTTTSNALGIGLGVGLVGGFLLILTIILIVIWFRKRKKEKKDSAYNTGEQPAQPAWSAAPHSERSYAGSYPTESSDFQCPLYVYEPPASDGVVYAELVKDSKPISRQPVENSDTHYASVRKA